MDTSLESAKSFMISQMTYMENFLKENQIQLVDEPAIFDEMLKKHPPEELLAIVRQFLPHGSDETELFIVLMEALSANDVLRRLAAETTQIVTRQDHDIRVLKRKTAEICREHEHELKALHKDREAAVADVVNSVRSVLREAVLNGENVQPVLESLETLNAAGGGLAGLRACGL
jgi:ribosome-interacting GTPase 1